MKSKTFICLLVGVFLTSCGNSSRSNPECVLGNDYSTVKLDEVDGRGRYEEYSNAEAEGAPDIGKIRLTGEIVQCNKCMGYGTVQNGLYGQPQICKFCWVSTNMRVQQGWTGFDGRYGQVDAVFNTLPTNYFDDLDWNTGGEYDNNGGTSADQIESEIARHEKSIAQLEHQLEYIEGTINRTQIERQIIEERYEIKRLKAMLNND